MDLGLFVCFVGVDMGFGSSGFELFGGSAGLWVGGNSSLVIMECGQWGFWIVGLLVPRNCKESKKENQENYNEICLVAKKW